MLQKARALNDVFLLDKVLQQQVYAFNQQQMMLIVVLWKDSMHDNWAVVEEPCL